MRKAVNHQQSTGIERESGRKESFQGPTSADQDRSAARGHLQSRLSSVLEDESELGESRSVVDTALPSATTNRTICASPSSPSRGRPTLPSDSDGRTPVDLLSIYSTSPFSAVVGHEEQGGERGSRKHSNLQPPLVFGHTALSILKEDRLVQSDGGLALTRQETKQLINMCVLPLSIC